MLGITSRWALMTARGWVRPILDRRGGLVNDRPNRDAAAEAPLDGAQERHMPTTPLATHAVLFTTAKRHSSLAVPCTYASNLAPPHISL